MTPDDIGRRLHDRATRGETLTPEEQEQLGRWYADHDQEEMVQLNAAPVPSRLADLQTRVQQATAQVVVQAQRIEALTAENAQLRQEIASLQRLLSGKHAGTAGMTVSREDVELVRARAGFACEYCGVTETDCGGPLTVDHHRPQAHGGGDGLDNLVYCCWRCNLHKAAYWPSGPTDPVLWNPRDASRDRHLLLLADGGLHGRTPTGEFTLTRLRLNRPGLVAHRARRLSQVAEQGLLERYRDLLTLLEQMQQRHAALLEDHRALLQEQRDLIRLLTSTSK